jgi:UDP:flavonoid glycosyltransferase YjiC (YdhE family)
VIAFLPNCGFISEVSRAIAIAKALKDRGVHVCFASRGGPYVSLIGSAGFECAALTPALDRDGCANFLEALLDMGKGDRPFFAPGELEASVTAETAWLREVKATAAVTGFTLSATLSTRLAGIPLVTDHGGSFLPPVLARGLCPVPVNPPKPEMSRLPQVVQRWMANRVPALLKAPVRQLNAHADTLGVERVPSLLSLMCGDLTLVTELAEVLGTSAESIEGWKPSWPFRVRRGTTFVCTGPLYAKLDAPIPPEVEAFLSQPEPVVYLAPTSVQTAFLRELILSAKRAGARLLVAATVHDVKDLGDDRTLIAGILPNHLVFPRVAAAVIMGGRGVCSARWPRALPSLGCRTTGNRSSTSRWRSGSASRFVSHRTHSSRSHPQFRRLLDEPSFAISAKAAAQRYAGVDGAARAAQAIVDYLAQRARAAA